MPTRAFTQAPNPPRVPTLLVELSPRHTVFLGNLRDLLFPRRLPPLILTSPPGRFWPDVLINDRLPWIGLRFSVAGHALIVGAIVALTYYGFIGTRPQQVKNPFQNTITYYSVADYLPEVNSGSKPSKVELKGEPAYATQEIISVPKEPDNTRQTIVTAWKMKLKNDVPLPNIVAWNPELPAAPISAIPGRKMQIALQPTVVAPAPEAVTREGAIQMPSELMKMPTAVAPSVEPISPAPRNLLSTSQTAVAPSVEPMDAPARKMSNPLPRVVGPSADMAEMRRALPTVAVPSVVEPVVNPEQSGRRPGALNLARIAPQVNAPNLLVPEQRALGVGQTVAGGGTQSPGSSTPATAPSRNTGGQSAVAQGAPATAAGAGTRSGGGQLIALSVDLATAKGPIEVPAGSRSGVFAASPTGKPGAPATPDLHKPADGAGGTATTGDRGTGSGTRNAPDGLFVGPGPATSPTGAVVASKTPAQPNKDFKDKLMAAARAPDIPRQTTPGSTVNSVERKITEQVFGPKKYYSLTLNMPNLTSSSGSWIIRFAELKETHDGRELAGPVPLSKVDPAYPAELLRDKVEGIVVLYAVIRIDGSIADIKVLKSVDERLDQNAMEALAKWHFKPGTKNGEPIDLEAVVQIPFRIRRSPF